MVASITENRNCRLKLPAAWSVGLERAISKKLGRNSRLHIVVDQTRAAGLGSYMESIFQKSDNVQSKQVDAPQIKDTMQGLKNIVQNQGWRLLFAGLSLNYVKVVPLVAIGFTASAMKSLLHVPPREKACTTAAAS